MRVCGRVVQCAADGLLLDDGSAARSFLRTPGDETVRAGDLVVLELPDASCVQPVGVWVVGRHAGLGEFPSPEGEWYRLHRNGARRLRNLMRRSVLLTAVRRFFADRGFVEIEAPLLVPAPGLELHLDAFAVGKDRYLITSPEYQLKRLLVGGLSRIFSLGKAFRRGEAGPQHNPEFTLLEWYRAWEGWEAVARDVEELCAELATAVAGRPRVRYRDKEVDLTPPWTRMTVAEALERYAGVRLRGDESTEELRHLLRRAGHDPRGAESWDDLFFSVFLDRVEPHLGRAQSPDEAARPVVLHDWPRPLGALARSKPGAPEVVERFEAYAGGLELCNGFGELCDPVEQRARFMQDLAERQRRGLPTYPLDERFLAALAEGMPPSGGVALGLDRLLMLLLEAEDISEVLPFAWSEL
ncbi:MAG: EF-P lysine aminoacylase EpmA [Myxococcales bacterium]|nr:EF-P lysine aminoacylase EpmA [Myxococcota bacterium]MDW8281984.1 EF-P lysine aminoacylase EpmA [Myxococcales bacterium]